METFVDLRHHERTHTFELQAHGPFPKRHDGSAVVWQRKAHAHVHVVVGPLREVGQEVGTLIEGRQGLHGIQWDLVCVLAATIRT
eukprot:CAMPEP_0194490372 /NCGR_PEP_ID=MMETSP0253-20130528/9612_1 /TAXON_ID=2966 /ORGANISM="Noctiluca scintillans" /LENGTH=84 /DNA_ID=CAMNT_0039330991 /DNA_START=227 /DNA_END=477 /DNA_ORIENTATION=+